MGPPTESDEFEFPRETLGGQAARTIERVRLTAAKWSMPLYIPVGSLFFIDVVGGYTASFVGIWATRYEFLSLSADSCVAWLGFVSGITIRVGAVANWTSFPQGRRRRNADRTLEPLFVRRRWLWSRNHTNDLHDCAGHTPFVHLGEGSNGVVTRVHTKRVGYL